MNKIAVTREQVLEHCDQLLQQGKSKAVKRLLLQVLAQCPFDMDARHRLRDLVKNDAFSDPVFFTNRFLTAYLGQQNAFIRDASFGWGYAWAIDSEFIDPDISKVKVQSKKDDSPVTVKQTDESAHDYIQKVIEEPGPGGKWNSLLNIVEKNNDTLLADSFAGVKDSDLQSTLAESVSGSGLNIVILGAGCIGLSLANALKSALGDGVNILVIENRVLKTHVKKPYERDWLTNLPLQLVHGIFDHDLIKIFRSLGDSRPEQERPYIGVPIHVFETLLLLSCKRLGVKFLFKEDYDLSFMKESKAHLVFDATGGNFNSNCPDEDSDPVEINIPDMPRCGEGNEVVGIKKVSSVVSQTATLVPANGTYYPYIDGQRIVHAMFKVTHIPIALKKELLDYILTCNDDTLAYLWNGTLRPELNQLMCLFNLQKPAYESLSSVLSDKMPLDAFLNDGGLETPGLDERVAVILKMIKESGEDISETTVEPPFLFEPHINLLPDRFDRTHGVPTVPIGDSVYNGNPKCGNGFGFHLRHLNGVHDLMIALYGERDDKAPQG